MLSRTFPEFVEIKAPSVWPGARMYVHRTPLASYFIRLVPSHDRDWFRVMYGWSSSGEFPSECRRSPKPKPDKDFPDHDGFEFRILKIINEAGGATDRLWILDDPSEVALDRTLQEFAKPGDTEIQTLERATSEGLSYLTSIHREVAVELLLPKIPILIEDCMQYIRDTVMSYFEKIKSWKSLNAA